MKAAPLTLPVRTRTQEGEAWKEAAAVKDLDTSPAWQRLFAHGLDLAMSPTSPVRYWPTDELAGLLARTGFDVKQHAMVDYLPYPHVLYVCTKI